jgi:hypothetical protein
VAGGVPAAPKVVLTAAVIAGAIFTSSELRHASRSATTRAAGSGHATNGLAAKGISPAHPAHMLSRTVADSVSRSLHGAPATRPTHRPQSRVMQRVRPRPQRQSRSPGSAPAARFTSLRRAQAIGRRAPPMRGTTSSRMTVRRTAPLALAPRPASVARVTPVASTPQRQAGFARDASRDAPRETGAARLIATRHTPERIVGMGRGHPLHGATGSAPRLAPSRAQHPGQRAAVTRITGNGHVPGTPARRSNANAAPAGNAGAAVKGNPNAATNPTSDSHGRAHSPPNGDATSPPGSGAQGGPARTPAVAPPPDARSPSPSRGAAAPAPSTHGQGAARRSPSAGPPGQRR